MAKGSMRAYARHRAELGLDGQTAEGVSRALDSNRISREPDGQIDFEKADAEWAANTKPSINNRTARHRGAIPRPPSAASTIRTAQPQVGSAQNQQSANGFAQARALKEGFHAGLAQLEFKKRSGELLPKAEIEQRWSALVSSARNRLLLVAAKCAPKMGGTDDVRERQAIIEREIREALQALSEEDDEAANAA